ncbi:MAG TPA: heme-binding protein [Ilumatobacteraceae bacterium]|nr:heme-binding protein [Ilumatobacteraceae bacterium]
MPDPDVVPMNALSLGAAQRVADAAIAAAGSKGVAVCIAICDPAGEPIVTIRMDRAARLCADIALNKAYTVSAFNGKPTHDWWAVLADDPALVHGFTQTPRLTIFAGGVPVRIDGKVVGAVGVSGGSSEQDREIAEAGAAAVGTSS